MFCSHCGNQVPDGSKFCAHCGAQTQAATPQAAPQQPYTPPQQTQPIYTAPQQAQKNAPIWLAAVIGLAAFAIAALIIAPVIRGSNNDASETNGLNNTQSAFSTEANTQSLLNTQADSATILNTEETTEPSRITSSCAQFDTWEFPGEENDSSMLQGSEGTDFISQSLEAIPVASQLGTYWEYCDSVCQIEVSVGYGRDNEVVTWAAFRMILNKEHREYAAFKSAMQRFESRRKAMVNERNSAVTLEETESGLEFFATFDSLNQTDRGQRIALAEDIFGVCANDSDAVFYFSKFEADLKSYGIVS